MQYVRNTLQTAQEITSVVHEAETVAEEAMRSASAIRDEHAHVDRLKPTTRHLYKFRNKVSNARAAETRGGARRSACADCGSDDEADPIVCPSHAANARAREHVPKRG